MEKELNENQKCSCILVICFIAFFIAIVTDFVLPLAFGYVIDQEYDNNNNNEDAELFDKNKNAALNVTFGVLGMIIASCIACPYTVITIYTTIRKRYISGDFLYNSKINDDISLMKTVQLVCGYSFALVYCNLYFWKSVGSGGILHKPYFCDEIIVPDYVFKQGISIYMLIKIVIIIFSIIAHLNLNKKFVYKNDLAEYNKLGDKSHYDKNDQFTEDMKKYKGIENILMDKNIS